MSQWTIATKQPAAGTKLNLLIFDVGMQSWGDKPLVFWPHFHSHPHKEACFVPVYFYGDLALQIGAVSAMCSRRAHEEPRHCADVHPTTYTCKQDCGSLVTTCVLPASPRGQRRSPPPHAAPDTRASGNTPVIDVSMIHGPGAT